MKYVLFVIFLSFGYSFAWQPSISREACDEAVWWGRTLQSEEQHNTWYANNYRIGSFGNGNLFAITQNSECVRLSFEQSRRGQSVDAAAIYREVKQTLPDYHLGISVRHVFNSTNDVAFKRSRINLAVQWNPGPYKLAYKNETGQTDYSQRTQSTYLFLLVPIRTGSSTQDVFVTTNQYYFNFDNQDDRVRLSGFPIRALVTDGDGRENPVNINFSTFY